VTSSISSQAPVNWITPEEQFERLTGIPKCLVSSVAESAIRTGSDPVPEEGEGGSLSRFSLFDLCVNKMVHSYPLTNWYIALAKLNALPRLIPSLPENICEIFEGACPAYRDPNINIKNTHMLSLIPEEFETLNHLENDILKPYGEANYPKDRNPLRFESPVIQEGYAYAPFAPTHWVLMTKDVLPESLSKTWDEQVALVDALSRQALVNYEIPTLQECLVALITHKVATGEPLYSAGANWDPLTFTHVKQAFLERHLYVGGWRAEEGRFGPLGVRIYGITSGAPWHIGIAALRVLS
jgi:hypothetical protein